MQQYLPFTVLKHSHTTSSICSITELQQYLPFTVLKLDIFRTFTSFECNTVATVPTVYGIETAGFLAFDLVIDEVVATVPTVYGIETRFRLSLTRDNYARCNSPYGLRYASKGVRQQRSKATMRPTHRLPERSEGKTKVMR